MENTNSPLTINFTNSTSKTRRVALYADDKTLDAVALCCIEVEAGKQLESPPIDPAPCVVIGKREPWEVGSLYETSVHEKAEPGSKWKITGEPGSLKLEPDGDPGEDTKITITNEAEGAVSAGVGFGEKGALYRRSLKNKESVSIDVGVGFKIALFEAIREGAVVYPSLAMEPFNIKSLENVRKIEATAVKNVETLELDVKTDIAGAAWEDSDEEPEPEETPPEETEAPPAVEDGSEAPGETPPAEDEDESPEEKEEDAPPAPKEKTGAAKKTVQSPKTKKGTKKAKTS